MLHLTLTDQVLHRACHVFNGHVRVDPMLIAQINNIRLEPLQRGLRNLFDMFRPAIQLTPTSLATSSWFKPKFGCYYDLITKRSEGFTHQLFIGERTIDLSRVEERDAAFHGCPDKRDCLLLIHSGTVAKAHAHTAEADGRDFQITFSKFALLHGSSFLSLTV